MVAVPDVAILPLSYMKLFPSPKDPRLGIHLKIAYLYVVIAIYLLTIEARGEAKMNSSISDITADIESTPLLPHKSNKNFSDIYKEKVFYIWYNHGKPQEGSLLRLVPQEIDEFGRLPTVSCLKGWIDVEFVPRARLLDEQIKTAMDAAMIAEKVTMLKKHAELGVKMQDMAIKYLNENQDIISSPAAVRLLVEGIRVERESRGIPAALEKITRMSDEDLLEQVKGILTQGTLSAEDSHADS
jgi:hypothetical protein